MAYASDPGYANEAGQSYTHYFDGRGQNTYEDWWSLDLSSRWTFPIWLYVSVTGVVIYYMLRGSAPGGAG